MRTETEKSKQLAFRALLMSKGYSYADMAMRLGLHRSGFSSRVSGVTDWRWSEVAEICRVAGITPNDFAKFFPGSR